MKKFILNKDRDELIEVQGSIVLVSPYKNRNTYFIGLEFYSGKKIIRKILGEYDNKKTSENVFKAILFFLGSKNEFTFVMPINFVE
ncbi:MAG: hypothetical protein J6A95_01765 [Clostridia bacterium]|nr:hypothetical protein [Clostridia bacterium]